MEQEVAAHAAVAWWMICGLFAIIGALVGLVLKLVWPRIDSTNSVDKGSCGSCREEIDAALAKGDDTHQLFQRTLLIGARFFKEVCDQVLMDPAPDLCKDIKDIIKELEKWPFTSRTSQS